MAVTVVPILHPKRIGKAPNKAMVPCEYRVCRIPIVAEEDRTSAVMNVPTNKPRIGYLEKYENNSVASSS